MNNNITPGLYATIDIGTKSVKAILLEVNNNKKRLLKVESVDIAPFDTFVNEEEYNKQITSAIAKLSKELDLAKCKKIISLFYNRDLQVKLIDFPNSVKPEQFDQVLPWEAKKILSPHYKEQEFTYSYSVIRGNPLSIALAVVPMQLLNTHLSLFNGTGIKPDSVYIDVFSTLSLQSIVDIAGLPALSIVNFGYSGTHLNIYSAGKLKFYRYIPSGTSEMMNPPKESELEMYSQKIRFSFDYFRAVSKLNQVDALFFMGGGSALPDVLNYEQNYFSPTKINPLDVSSEIDISPVISVSFNDEVNTENNQKLLPFVPAIGGCLAYFRDDAEAMDLLALIRKQNKEKNLEKLASTVPIILGLISFIFASFLLYFQYTEKIEKIENLDVSINSVSDRINNLQAELNKKKNKENPNPIKLCENSLKLVKPVIQTKNSLNYFFQIINKVKPEKLQITDILIRNKQEAEQINLKTKEELENDNNIFDFSIESDYDNDEESNQQTEPQTNQTINSSLYDIFAEEEPKEQPKPIKRKAEKKPKKNNNETKTSPVSYTSIYSLPINEQQIKEDFDGKIVIIHGFAENSIEVTNFTDALTTNPIDSKNNVLPSALLRYIGINLREADNKKIEFLLKGELK